MAVRLFLLALTYFTTGWLGLQMPSLGNHVTLLWLPTGIAVAALFRWGRAVWPGVFIGSILLTHSVGATWLVAFGVAVGNTLAPLLAAQWLRQWKFLPGFDRQRDVGLFTVAAAVGMLVSASNGVACLYWGGVISIDSLGAAWLYWWMGDTVGALLAGPLLLTFNRKSLDQFRHDRKALLLWIAFAIPVAWLAFVHDYAEIGRPPPLAFLTLPLFVWAAMRLRITGAALAGLVFSIVAALSTATGHGVFALPNPHVSLILLWTYMASTVLTGMLITAMQAERHQVETTLRESQQNLAITLNAIDNAVIATDAAGCIVRMNPSAERLTGWPLVEALGRPLADVFCIVNSITGEPMADPVEFFTARQQVVGHANHVLLQARDGQQYRISNNAAPIHNGAGEFIGAVLVFSDVTEKYREQEILLRERNFTQQALDSLPGLFYLFDQEGRFLRWNQNFEKISGYDSNEMSTLHPLDFFGPADKGTVEAAIGSVFTQGEVQLEAEFVSKRQTRTPFLFIGKRYIFEQKVCLMGVGIDITERKQAEQALQQSLKDKQALLMEVHHRVKNNLQVISSLLRLETRRSAHADTKSVLTDMQGRIRSMALLHEALYRSGTFASVDLGGYLKQLVTQAFKTQSTADGAVRLQLDVASVSVGMDQAIPCGLLVNELISNCLKHGLPHGSSGEVKVELQAVDPNSLQAGALWRLCVSDNGVGLPPDFEVKRKTSLGLQLVDDLSRQMDGTLAIQSRPGAGAEFTVIFKSLAPESLVMPF